MAISLDCQEHPHNIPHDTVQMKTNETQDKPNWEVSECAHKINYLKVFYKILYHFVFEFPLTAWK